MREAELSIIMNKIHIYIQKIVFIIILINFCSSCSVMKHLKPDEQLLYSQSIEGVEVLDTEELELFYRQKPNRRILFTSWMPYLSAYYVGLPRYKRNKESYKAEILELEEELRQIMADEALLDRRKYRLDEKYKRKIDALKVAYREGNWLMRSIGEKPTLFDSAKMVTTAEKLQIFIRQEGYFSASVTPEYEVKNKKVFVKYIVNQDLPHYINKLEVVSEDTALLHFVQKVEQHSVLEPGHRFERKNLVSERERLAKAVKEFGYFHFMPDYIFYELDTIHVPKPTENQRFMNIKIRLETPENDSIHHRYRIAQVNFTSDLQKATTSTYELDSITGEVIHRPIEIDTLRANRKNFMIHGQRYSPKILSEKISIHEDKYYHHSRTVDTQKALAQMGVFKFVNVRYDTLSNHQLSANIFVNSFDKYDVSAEAGASVSQSLPGPFIALGWRTRNILGAGDILDVSLTGSIESQVSNTSTTNNQSYNSNEINLNSAFSIPTMIFPFLNKTRRDKIGIFRTNTKLTAGWVYTNRPEYTRTTVTGGFGYTWDNGQYSSFKADLLNVGIIRTRRLSPNFLGYLFDIELDNESGNKGVLLRSFESSLLSSSAFSFTYNNDKNIHAIYWHTHLEAGGSYLNLFGNDFLAENATIFGLEYYRYYRLQTELRYYIPMGKTGKIAMRANFGLARSYGAHGDEESVLPYDKHFFLGGSNSIRAWRPRRLGPGSFTPFSNEDGSFDYSFEQPGELMLEANIEYRNKLVSIINWAMFLDAGNVWFTRPNTRIGTTFDRRTFLSELGVGAGLGLRFDLSFLVMRFDAATKIFDPALPYGSRFVGRAFSIRELITLRGQSVLNIGIGYPF